MARNGSGTYTKAVSSFSPGGTITASDHNSLWDDVALEITNSVAADGQTTMTGPLKAANGTAAAPTLTFASDTDTGWYRAGVNSVGLALEGSAHLVFTTSSATWNKALNVGGELNVSATATFQSGILVSSTAVFSHPILVSGTATFTKGFIASATSTFVAPILCSGTATFTNGFIASATAVFVAPILCSGTATFTLGFIASATSTFTETAIAKNTAKAYGHATISGSTLTNRRSVGGTWTRTNTAEYTFTFTVAQADAFYTAIPSVTHSSSNRHTHIASKSTTAVVVRSRLEDGSGAEAEGIDIVVYNS
jgi:hypothetical protein